MGRLPQDDSLVLASFFSFSFPSLQDNDDVGAQTWCSEAAMMVPCTVGHLISRHLGVLASPARLFGSLRG